MAGSGLSGPGPFRWVSGEGFHLTLKFLGNVPAGRVPAVGDALVHTVADHGPFDLELSRAGVLPDSRSPRVIWAGLASDVGALVRLQEAVEPGLSALGFAPETRAFTPHLTLSRVRRRLAQDEQKRLKQTLERVETPKAQAFRVTEVGLLQSALLPSGAVYQRLREAALRGG